MIRNFRDGLNIFVGAIVLGGFLTIVNTVDVRLSDGQGENQGRVEIRRDDGETWGKVCDLNFGEEEAAVICRQLNYKFSRTDEQFYIPDYPDYRLENFHCQGNESKFEDCIDEEWKSGTGICDTKRNAFAGVCCSNSATFGEMHDDVFISHCADNWIDAEEICEAKKATLASLDEYKSIGPDLSDDMGTKNKGYWTKSFFTPWIWSNGCYKFHANTFDHQEFNLENNTAQACLQTCSIASEPSSFLLSGKYCRCLPTQSLKSYITEVIPGWCNIKCLGDSKYFCGKEGIDSDNYWSLYTIASEDIFYRIADPHKNQHRQCAILEASKKLSSENCYKRVGYICGQILQENTTLPKLMFFQNSRFYEVYMHEARMKCTSDDSTMRLIGEKILEQDVVFSQPFVNLWVDISRILADVYTIYWKPKNHAGTSLWRHLEPRWCMATYKNDIYFSDEITACQDRFRYICSINKKKGQIPSTNGSSSQNSSDTGTGYNHNNSITDAHDNEITSVHVNHVQDENSKQTSVIAGVICGLLIILTIVVIVIIYKRIKKKRQSYRQQENGVEGQELHAQLNEYSASIRRSGASPEHIYAEIKPSSENIYNEIDTLLEEPDAKEDVQNVTNDASADIDKHAKEEVTMKRSYSSPKDLTNLVEGSQDPGFKDPNYIYPYDKVQRSETDSSSPAQAEEEKALEKVDNEIKTQHNKQTVV